MLELLICQTNFYLILLSGQFMSRTFGSNLTYFLSDHTFLITSKAPEIGLDYNCEWNFTKVVLQEFLTMKNFNPVGYILQVFEHL